MTTKTRYFVIVSLLVLGVGLGTGLVAYYVGFPAAHSPAAAVPRSCSYIPRDAAVIAFANVQRNHDLGAAAEAAPRDSDRRKTASSELREPDRHQHRNRHRHRRRLPEPGRDGNGMPSARDGAGARPLRRDEDRSADARARRARRGLQRASASIVADADSDCGRRLSNRRSTSTSASRSPQASRSRSSKPGLVGHRQHQADQSAIDLHKAEQSAGRLESVTGNDELMNLVRSLDSDERVGGRPLRRAPQRRRTCRRNVLESDSGDHLVRGQRAHQRRRSRHDRAPKRATTSRRTTCATWSAGSSALAKLQAGSKPELQAMMQSLELGGTGKTVSLSFAVPARGVRRDRRVRITASRPRNSRHVDAAKRRRNRLSPAAGVRLTPSGRAPTLLASNSARSSSHNDRPRVLLRHADERLQAPRPRRHRSQADAGRPRLDHGDAVRSRHLPGGDSRRRRARAGAKCTA